MAPPRKNPVDEAGVKLLRAVGKSLYGEKWYAKMGRQLDGLSNSEGTLDASVVRRWDIGERSMPDWVVPRLALVIEGELVEIDRWQEHVEKKRVEIVKMLHRVESHGMPTSWTPPTTRKSRSKVTPATRPAPARPPAPVEQPEPGDEPDEDAFHAPEM